MTDMWNIYFSRCLNFSEDCKLGLGWYKHAKTIYRGGNHKGFTLHVFLPKNIFTLTFVTNHEQYVNMITRNGRWSFDYYRLRKLPLPERKPHGPQKQRN